jgi:hypothetical protein
MLLTSLLLLGLPNESTFTLSLSTVHVKSREIQCKRRDSSSHLFLRLMFQTLSHSFHFCVSLFELCSKLFVRVSFTCTADDFYGDWFLRKNIFFLLIYLNRFLHYRRRVQHTNHRQHTQQKLKFFLLVLFNSHFSSFFVLVLQCIRHFFSFNTNRKGLIVFLKFKEEELVSLLQSVHHKQHHGNTYCSEERMKESGWEFPSLVFLLFPNKLLSLFQTWKEK